MANIRVNDFILIALGAPPNIADTKIPMPDFIDVAKVGDPFPNIPDPLTKFPAMASFDRSKYDASLKWFKEPRTLTQIAVQVGEDVDAMATTVIKVINARTGNNLATIGTFCAIGSSNCSGLVLSVAAQLKALGAPKLTYIAVTDVTIMPSGRNKTITGVGNLAPAVGPDISALPGKPYGRPGKYVSAAMLTPPRVTLSGPIDSRTLRNFYQVEGNRVRVPWTGARAFDWWWWSDMDGEVHGLVDGADNVRFIGTATNDTARHVEICQHDDTLGRSRREAEQALSEFPL